MPPTDECDAYSVLLFTERGVDKRKAQEVAGWFEKHPGPVTVKLQRSQVELRPHQGGRLLWKDLFDELASIRVKSGVEKPSFIYLLTKTPNESNWYAAEDPHEMRNGFGHFADFEWVTTAPQSVIATHFILKAIFNALLDEARVDWPKLWHQVPRGCFFDFCANKADLAFKLRTADICGDCMRSFKLAGIPDSLIRQAVSIMEDSRRLALNTSQYLEVSPEFDRWPFPVAITRHKVVQASSPFWRFMLLIDHFDSMVRYFFLAHEIDAGRSPTILDQPSLGWWVAQLSEAMQGERAFREVVRIAEEGKVVNLRNERRGHGFIAPDEESYRGEASNLESILSEIEMVLLPFFENHRLVIPRQVGLIDGLYRVEGDDLVGSHLLHPKFRIQLTEGPRSIGILSSNEVYLTDSRLSSFKCMSPFIRSTNCPECRHPRVLITDGA